MDALKRDVGAHDPGFGDERGETRPVKVIKLRGGELGPRNTRDDRVRLDRGD